MVSSCEMSEALGGGRAPRFSVPPTEIVAVEHPMVVKNVDNALKTFGRGLPFEQMMNRARAEDCLPLYLRPNDPACAVLESHVALTSNVVLKITVPKRTGRKRKRGSQGPFVGDEDSVQPSRPDASTVFQSIKDNIDKYEVEAVGVVNTTHRYRGMADFHKSTVNSPFVSRFREQVLSSKLDDFKSFRFNPDRGYKLNEDVIPPPYYAESNLPYPWAYQRGMEMPEEKRIKPTKSRIKKEFSFDLSLPVPTGPKKEPGEKFKPLIKILRECFEVRPIWTKRALENYLGNRKPYGEIKHALPFVSYQFHGGPWRDASVKFGVDPRRDPKCRIYQSLMFKILPIHNVNTMRDNWVMADYDDEAIEQRKWKHHIFDGQSVGMDGRIWQICDITDPLLRKVFSTDTVREVPNLKQDGWYYNGTFAKAKAIMRTKIRALQTGQKLSDEDFEEAMKVPDNIILTDDMKCVSIPLPQVTIIRKPEEKEWLKTKKQRNGENMATFKMNTDHGSKRGKRLDAKTVRDALAIQSKEPGMDESIRPSIETGGDNAFATIEPGMTEEGNIMDEDGDDDDDNEEEDEDDEEEDDDDASLDLHDDSSLDSDQDEDDDL